MQITRRFQRYLVKSLDQVMSEHRIRQRRTGQRDRRYHLFRFLFVLRFLALAGVVGAAIGVLLSIGLHLAPLGSWLTPLATALVAGAILILDAGILRGLLLGGTCGGSYLLLAGACGWLPMEQILHEVGFLGAGVATSVALGCFTLLGGFLGLWYRRWDDDTVEV